MTILAQLNDCHCCNDARSLVQKKAIPPTHFIWRRDSSQSSSQPKRREAHLTRENVWHDLLVVSHLELWLGRLNVRTRVHEYPLGIFVAVHMGVSRGPPTS